MVLSTSYSPRPSSPRSSRVRSRFAQKEQKKIAKQSLLYVVLAVGLGLLFVFFIAPKTINLVFRLIDSGAPLTAQDTLPPQVPIISAPPAATTSPKLTLIGFGEPESMVSFVLSGEKTATIVVASDGTFSQDLELAPGENTVAAYSADAAGNESPLSRTYTIVLDSQAPLLELSQPKDGQSFELSKNRTIAVVGTTESKAKITVNGRLTLSDAAGAFSTTYYLQEGANELILVATDEAGNTTERKILVSFSLQ